eukprot:g17606.t1
MLSWAGVGLGGAESFQVMCSLRNLAANQKDGLNKLRFWGKAGHGHTGLEGSKGRKLQVLGTEADYYVAEAQRDGGDEDPDPDADQPGQGANQFTYYVTNDLAGAWRKLPDIKPKEILAARAIKRLLTGNAGSKDGDVGGGGGWRSPHILLNGRTVHQEIPEGDTEDEIALAAKMKEEQEADPVPELIRGLHEDHLQWSVKQAGDATMSSAVVYVRSLSWPGAVCAIRNGQFVNIYVGYGLAAVSSNFFPMAPPDDYAGINGCNCTKNLQVYPTAFKQGDVGIHLHVKYDPKKESVLDAKTYAVPNLDDAPKPPSADVLEKIEERAIEVMVENAECRQKMSQVSKALRDAPKLPQEMSLMSFDLFGPLQSGLPWQLAWIHQLSLPSGEPPGQARPGVPRFLYEAAVATRPGSIAVTQPRRIAAISVAHRVASEMGCEVGDLVGYHVRFLNRTSSKTKLKCPKAACAPKAYADRESHAGINGSSIVVLDEAHERGINTDVLLGLVKLALEEDKPPGLRVVVMSATIHAAPFVNFFGGSKEVKLVKVPGRQHPVQVFYTPAPEPDIIEAALISVLQLHLTRPAGDVLVFLPGQDDIESLQRLLEEKQER